MKKFSLLMFAIVALTFLGCGGNTNQRLYERYQYDSARIEFIYPEKDSVVLEEEEEASWADDNEGLLKLPDIPQERQVNMSASDYELEKIMSGKGN